MVAVVGFRRGEIITRTLSILSLGHGIQALGACVLSVAGLMINDVLRLNVYLVDLQEHTVVLPDASGVEQSSWGRLPGTANKCLGTLAAFHLLLLELAK